MRVETARTANKTPGEGARRAEDIGEEVGDEQCARETDGECGGDGSQRMTDSKGEINEQEAADGDAGQRGEDAEEIEEEGRVNGDV